MRGERRREESSAWKGLAAGLVGGLVASVVMNQFQAAWTLLSEGFEKSHGAQSMQPSGGEHQERPKLEQADEVDATERLASIISENVLDRSLSEPEQESAGTAIHYAYGTGTGAVYGTLAEFLPGVTRGRGMPFGVAVWAVGDEGFVPALGLSKGPAAYSLATHAYSFSSHLVYGLTTELVRRAVRRLL